jgi:hypothetical protein
LCRWSRVGNTLIPSQTTSHFHDFANVVNGEIFTPDDPQRSKLATSSMLNLITTMMYDRRRADHANGDSRTTPTSSRCSRKLLLVMTCVRSFEPESFDVFELQGMDDDNERYT